MPSKNRFDVNGEVIYISRDGWEKLATTTYREDYYEELTSVTWTENEGYLVNKKLGSLHRYIMKQWYGEDVVKSMTEKNWVVDHMNNNGFDCRISNLEFLASRHNVAKGQTLDVEADQLRLRIALTLCKDFSTGLYQIHIGCNDNILWVDQTSGIEKNLAKLKLLYNSDYRIVINDAEQILLDYVLEGKVELNKLKWVDYKTEVFKIVSVSEEEKGRPLIERDGIKYMAMGNHIWFYSSALDKGWIPPEK